MKKTIGIIGYGNMGSAIAERIKKSYQVIVFDKDKEKTRGLSGIGIASGSIDLTNKVDIVVLAVKPQDFDSLSNEIKENITDKLVISIAAGICTTYMERTLSKAHVVRVMPNIGAKIGEAESSLSKGKSASDKDLQFARELFDLIGKTWIMQEEMMDAVTAISGSGPAYIYYDMEINNIDPLNIPEEIKQGYIQRLKRAAEKVGFDDHTAEDLAVNTTNSSLRLTAVTGMSPAELRKQVTSKGGTTEAALKILAEGGSWEEAAEAAWRRAKELAKKE